MSCYDTPVAAAYAVDHTTTAAAAAAVGYGTAEELAIRRKVKKKRSGSNRLLSAAATAGIATTLDATTTNTAAAVAAAAASTPPSTPTTPTAATASATGAGVSQAQNNKANRSTKSELAKSLHKWRVGPPPARRGLSSNSVQNATTWTTVTTATMMTPGTTASDGTAKTTTTATMTTKSTQSAAGSVHQNSQRSRGDAATTDLIPDQMPICRTLNPKGTDDPLVNDSESFSLLQAAQQWITQANMIRHRHRTESLGDSWWAEYLPSAMKNQFLMHGLLAAGGIFIAVRTRSKEQTPNILYHNGMAMTLLRKQLVQSQSTPSTLQALVLLSSFAFYVGDSHSGIAHLRAAHLTIKTLGGFESVSWPAKTFLISAQLAISAELKMKPIIPIEEWDEGPLDQQPWMTNDIRRQLVAAGAGAGAAPPPPPSPLPSSLLSLEPDDPGLSWQNWLLPTKQLFSFLDFVRCRFPPSAESPIPSLFIRWIHNRRFVIKAHLLEEYTGLVGRSDAGVYRHLEAASCLALIFSQSLILFDAPQLVLMHEPRHQLGSLLAEIFQPTISYGSQRDHHTLLWITFVGAACELALKPSIVQEESRMLHHSGTGSDSNSSGHDQAWFSTIFLQCVQALGVKTVHLPTIFSQFIWREDKFLPHIFALEKMRTTKPKF